MNTFLYDFQANDGAPIYYTEEQARPNLSLRIQKLWSETAFAKLDQEALEAGDDAIEEDVQPVKELPAGELTQEQVAELKRDMLLKLNIASLELEKGLDLINTILPYQPNNEEATPNFPLGQDSLAAAVLTTPLPAITNEAQLAEASLALAIKTNAVQDASQALLAASENLEQTAAHAKSDWDSYLNWHEQGWKLEARGADRTASYTTAFDRLSKDIVANVACEEASASIRHLSVAYLDLQKDADGPLQSTSKVMLPERVAGKRRLRLVLKQTKSNQEFSYYHPIQHDLLQEGQREVFEEEMYALIAQDVQKQSSREDPTMKGTVEESETVVVLSAEWSLTISIVKTSLLVEPAPNPYLVLTYCALCLRLLLVYHSRRSAVHTFPQISTPAPSILPPVLAILQYFIHIHYLGELLDRVRNLLSPIGLPISLQSVPMVGNFEKMVDLLTALPKPKDMLGGMSILSIAGQEIRLFFNLPGDTFIELKHTRLALNSRSQIEDILASEVGLAITRALVFKMARAESGSQGNFSVWSEGSKEVKIIKEFQCSFTFDQGCTIKCEGMSWSRQSSLTVQDWIRGQVDTSLE